MFTVMTLVTLATRIAVEGRTYGESQIPPMRRYKNIAPGYFQTMGNPLLAGRDLTWSDIYDLRPMVIVLDDGVDKPAPSTIYWPVLLAPAPPIS